MQCLEIGAAWNRRCSVWLAVIALAAFLPLTAHAQVSTASVTGTVMDSQGAVVPNASIALINVDTRVEMHSETNETGRYVIINITPGRYTLEATKPGFTTPKVAPFTLTVNQKATLDLILAVGSVQQSVTVEAVGADVQSATSELGGVVQEKQIVDLPLNGRNFTQMLMLTPGVAPVQVGGSQTTGYTRAIGSVIIPSVNGQTNRSNLFLLDGVNNSEVFGNAYAVPPIIDSIQEFKVQSHNDSAEFGGVMGGTINVVTKSGTNQLHGSLYEFLKNDAFNARNTFQSTVSPFKQNQFGASAGGPVILPKLYNGKDKTFFFMAYEGFRYSRPARSYYRVPTEANLRGDFSDSPRAIFDPASTRLDPSNDGSYIRDPFPENIIPEGRLDPSLVYYSKTVLPVPIATDRPTYNALDNTPSRTRQDGYNVRIDHNFRERDFVWFRWSGTNQEESGSGGLPSLSSTNAFYAKNLASSWVHTFGPTSILQTQFGYISTSIPSSTRFSNLPADFADKMAFSPDLIGGFVGGLSLYPSLGVDDYFGAGESVTTHQPADRQWQLKTNYSKVFGRHTFKMGGEFTKLGEYMTISNSSIGFRTYETSQPQNSGETGNSLATFLLNVPNSANKRAALESMGFGGLLGFYFQDQWQVTPKLSVNLGLRYDRTFIPPFGRAQDENQYVGNMDLNTGIYTILKTPPACATANRPPCMPTPDGSLPEHVVVSPDGKFWHDTTRNFQPRIGVAYRLFPRTAIRAGFGVFFDNLAGIIQTARQPASTWPSVGALQSGNLNSPTTSEPYPGVRAQSPLKGVGLPDATPFGTLWWFSDPNWKNAYSLQWNLGIQHQLSNSSVVTLNYVGSGGRRLDVGAMGSTAVTPGPGDPEDRRPFPWVSPTIFQRSIGRSSYHSLQASLNRTFSHGLTANLSYTWSKSIDTGCSGFFGAEGCDVQDYYHPFASRSVSSFDLPHVFTAGWVYELPFGTGKALHTGLRTMDYVIGNWQLNGILTLQTGQPFTLATREANCGCGGNVLPDLVAGKNPNDAPSGGRTVDGWFDTSAVTAPAVGTGGNLGLQSNFGPPLHNVDLSLFKRFPLGEKRNLQFRVEAMNAANTPHFGFPNNTQGADGFGRINSSYGERSVQFAIRLQY